MTETIIGCVTVLAEAFGRKLTKTTIEAYAIGLRGLSDQQIKKASEAAIQSCKFMPSPAELRELAGVARVSDRAELAWLALESAMGRLGAYKSVDFDDRVTNAVIRSLGGWQALFEVESKDWEFYRGKFLKSYEALSRAGVGDQQSAPLLGLFDQENMKNGFGAKPPVLIATGIPGAGPRGIEDQRKPKAIAAELPKLRAP
jgi:hypothetical protein